jgi:hypothetical protein
MNNNMPVAAVPAVAVPDPAEVEPTTGGVGTDTHAGLKKKKKKKKKIIYFPSSTDSCYHTHGINITILLGCFRCCI